MMHHMRLASCIDAILALLHRLQKAFEPYCVLCLTCRAWNTSWGLCTASPSKCARKMTPARTGQLKWPVLETFNRSTTPAYQKSRSAASLPFQATSMATKPGHKRLEMLHSHAMQLRHSMQPDRTQLCGISVSRLKGALPLTDTAGKAMCAARRQSLRVKLDGFDA